MWVIFTNPYVFAVLKAKKEIKEHLLVKFKITTINMQYKQHVYKKIAIVSQTKIVSHFVYIFNSYLGNRKLKYQIYFCVSIFAVF